MVSERDRILIDYIKSFNIEVNIKKNKAQGNNGFFRYKSNENFRIDVSNKVSNDDIQSTLLHEFAHFIHYKYDPTLNNLDFIFDDFDDEIKEELLRITVENIPKDMAESLFKEKTLTQNNIESLTKKLKSSFSDFMQSRPYKKIESKLSIPIKYLINYDNVKFLNNIYSIKDIDKYNLSLDAVNYLKLKSQQRKLKRINNKISRLNNYYTKPTELFARFIELYFTDNNSAHRIAPKSYTKFKSHITNNSIPELTKLNNLLRNKKF